MNIVDYRTIEQKCLDNIRSYVYDRGYEVKIDRRQSLAAHSEVSGTMTLNGQTREFTGMAMAKTRMISLVLAEIDFLKSGLLSFKEQLNWEDYTPESNPTVPKIEEKRLEMEIDRPKTDFPTYNDIFSLKTLDDVYTLLEPFKKEYLELKNYHNLLVAKGERLSIRKAADFICPKRSALKIGEKPKEVSLTAQNEERVQHKIAAALSGKGINPLNYVEKIGKDMLTKYPTFELLCKHLSNGDFKHIFGYNKD